MTCWSFAILRLSQCFSISCLLHLAQIPPYCFTCCEITCIRFTEVTTVNFKSNALTWNSLIFINTGSIDHEAALGSERKHIIPHDLRKQPWRRFRQGWNSRMGCSSWIQRWLSEVPTVYRTMVSLLRKERNQLVHYSMNLSLLPGLKLTCFTTQQRSRKSFSHVNHSPVSVIFFN